MAEESTFETRRDAGEGGEGAFRLWKTALDLAEKDEKDWRKRAQDAIDRFRDEKDRKGHRYNILYSSVQTAEPAMYNSTPVPDIRRRFGDEDPVGKAGAEVLERALSHSVEEYDFDSTMEAVVHDSLLPGRGVAVVVYDPVVGDGGVDYESVRCEHVQWDDFRHGPGKKWSDVPWIAVRYRITREEATALNAKIGPTVTLDYCEQQEENPNQVHDVFKRLTVWKIWDKAKQEILFLAPSYKDGLFAKEKDLLGLKGFFPTPKPLCDILETNSLVPLVPYDMYRDQAEELDRVTRRITVLVNALRWRGIRPAQIEELDRLKDAEDGELVPSQSLDALAMSGGDPDKAIWLMPIDKLIQVVRELVIQREAIKNVVFEISGLADIMRGETDPNETLGAQQIKAQWGSMRMQRRQREVQRYARDLLRLKAEIIGEHFSTETLAMITGVRLPTLEQKMQARMAAQQAQMTGQPVPPNPALTQPTWEEVKQVISSDAMRSYRIDIETDSTIQADQTRAQQSMATFVEGLAAFGQAVGPAVQSGVMPMDVVTDLLASFARNFRLGKQAEDALDRLSKMPPPQKADPEAERMKAELQMKQQEAQLDAQREEQKAQRDAQIEAQKAQAEIVRKQQEAQVDEQLARMKAAADIQIEEMKANAKIAIEEMLARVRADIEEDKAERAAEKETEDA